MSTRTLALLLILLLLIGAVLLLRSVVSDSDPQAAPGIDGPRDGAR